MLTHRVTQKASGKTYIEDVFSAYTYTGNGSTQTITNGIDLSTYGGQVHIKDRTSGTVDHAVHDTVRGANNLLRTNLTNANAAFTDTVTSFTGNGFSVGANVRVNTSGDNIVSWSFRNALKFFLVTTATKSAGSNATVDLSTLGTVGMVKVKRTDSTGSWYVWHRSLTAGKLLIGETTAAEATLGHITVSGTTLTLVDGVIANGTYHIEAYAHDTSADGLIQCGSFTTDGSGNATVTLGWEPQFVPWKASNAIGNWIITDNARGMPVGGNDKLLYANLANAEDNSSSGVIDPTATGFTMSGAGAATTFVYAAIRRGPMRKPTSGMQVYNAISRSGTGAAAAITGVGFPPDVALATRREGSRGTVWFDRLRGATKRLNSSSTAAEATDSSTLTSFDMDGISVGADSFQDVINYNNPSTFINHFLRRYPGVFDEVVYKGTDVAHAESHNLTVTPEMIIAKSLDGAYSWRGYHASLGATKYFQLNGNNGPNTDSTIWNNTEPTATQFTVGTAGVVNDSTKKFMALLIATLPGVSKVDGYNGTGAIHVVDCGFSAGARFALLYRTDIGAANFYLWDSVRGIVSGNDPYLLLNSTSSEVTGTDYIDPHASGFELPAGSPLNVNGGSYIFFAIA
jgi:hypothetical protein